MGWFSDSWIGKAASNIGSAVASTVEAVTTPENYVKAFNATMDGIEAAGDWVVGKEKPVLDDDGNQLYNEDGTPQVTHGWLHDTAFPAIGDAAVALTKAETYKNAATSVANFSKFAWDNPGRAMALAAQGTLNAVSSTVGFAADAVYGIGHAAVAGVVNLGRDDDNKMSYTKESGFFGFTTGLTDALQIRNLPIENEAFQKAFGEIAMYVDVYAVTVDGEFTIVRDANGKLVGDPKYKDIDIKDLEKIEIKNPNANYERVLLYGPQAVAEVGIFLATSAVTAGAGGAAYAAAKVAMHTTRAAVMTGKFAKAAQLTARTTAMVKRGSTIKTAINSGAKLAKAEAKLAAKATTNTTAKAAKELAETTAKAADDAAEVVTKAGSKATEAEIKLAAETKLTAEAAKQSKVAADTAVKAAEKATKDITEKAVAKATTKAEKGAARLSENPKQFGREWNSRRWTGRSLVKDLNADDLLQHVARNGKKSFEKIAKAEKVLADAASTPKQIAAAQKQIAKSEAKITELIEKTNVLGKAKGLEPITMEAAKATEITKVIMTNSQYIANTSTTWAAKTYQFMHPFNGKIGSAIEVTAAGGTMGLGIYANKAAAEKKHIERGEPVEAAGYNFVDPRQSNASVPFNNQSGASKNAHADSLGIETGHDVKGQFDNRTSGGTFIPNTGFSIEVEVTKEEAKILEQTLGGK